MMLRSMWSGWKRMFVAVAVCGMSTASAALYPPVEAASTDIGRAIGQAGHEHKNVLIDFGGDWCGDCKVLDANLHKPENAALINSDFVVVHVNVGADGITDNFVVAQRYGIPLKKGVPALAVLDSSGKLLYAQRNGEFESMRHMDPDSVHQFLVQWMPKQEGAVAATGSNP